MELWRDRDVFRDERLGCLAGDHSLTACPAPGHMGTAFAGSPSDVARFREERRARTGLRRELLRLSAELLRGLCGMPSDMLRW